MRTHLYVEIYGEGIDCIRWDSPNQDTASDKRSRKRLCSV